MLDNAKRVNFADQPYWLKREDHDEIHSLSSTTLSYGDLSVGHYRRDRPGGPETSSGSSPSAAMFMAVVNVHGRPAVRGWWNDRAIEAVEVKAGGLGIFDLRHSWNFLLPPTFNSFHAFISQETLDEVTTELKQPKIEQIHCPVTTCRSDLTMLGLAQSLIPLLEHPAQGNRLFTDHVFSAMLIYIATTYGGLQRDIKPVQPICRRGMLTPLQERNVKGRLLDDLSDVPGIAQLASICDLSRSHFVRAFKQTMGFPPHRWLLMQRVEQAKVLLQNTKMMLAEIALECGFADQSHFTRVFTKFCGTSPYTWRRHKQD